jgi:hypothetical protein
MVAFAADVGPCLTSWAEAVAASAIAPAIADTVRIAIMRFLPRL